MSSPSCTAAGRGRGGMRARWSIPWPQTPRISYVLNTLILIYNTAVPNEKASHSSARPCVCLARNTGRPFRTSLCTGPPSPSVATVDMPREWPVPLHGLLADGFRRITKWKGEMGPTLIGLLQESVVKFSSLAALKMPQPRGGLPDRHLRGAVHRREGAGHRAHLHRPAPGHPRGHALGKQPPLAHRRPGHPRMRGRRRARSARA